MYSVILTNIYFKNGNWCCGEMRLLVQLSRLLETLSSSLEVEGYNLQQLYLFYIFTVTYFCSNSSIFT